MAACVVVAWISMSVMNPVNAQPAAVTCNGEYCTCPTNASVSGACILNCMEADICAGAIFTCRSGDICLINCHAKATCSDITIHAMNATDAIVTCSAEGSCTNRIDVICGSGDCLLRCDGAGSCVNLSYSITKQQATVQTKCPSILSNISITNPAGIIMIALILVCCALTVLCAWFNCLFRRTMKRWQKERKEKDRVQSKSRVSTTTVSHSGRPRKSSTSQPHQYQSRTPRTSSVYTEAPITPMAYVPYNTPRAENADDSANGGNQSPVAHFPTLPLSMTIPEFKVCVTNGSGDHDEDQQSDLIQ